MTDKNINNTSFSIITVANLVPKKNLNLVLDIAKELRDVRFIIVGEGRKKINLQKFLNR